MMLQQTQVERVIPKYRAFLKAYPSAHVLARASLVDVLKLWSGLGYNRRALYLQHSAQAIVTDFASQFPRDAEILETLPGVGPYTARAIATFSFNTPYVFVETNIRAVFINYFFPRARSVSDKKLIPYIAASLNEHNPRGWYFALMDYGAHLKKTLPNPSRRSTHHVRQDRFEGSLRQMRGAILRMCTDNKQISTNELLRVTKKADKIRFEKALAGLVRDGFLGVDTKGCVTIKG